MSLCEKSYNSVLTKTLGMPRELDSEINSWHSDSPVFESQLQFSVALFHTSKVRYINIASEL